MRVLFVRAPKYLWPYMNEQDNFLLPQALAWLGAAARGAGHDVRLLDCLPLKMGWRSLEQAMRDFQPQVVLAGDSETLYAHESGRVFALAKAVDPQIATVAGGVHFTHASADAFARYPIDVIVRGEGETTLVELLAALADGRDLDGVAGLAFPRDGRLVCTAPRALVEDLDGLPPPAYDLLPMNRYGQARYLFSPGGVTIHHGRGCTSGCRFCACWLQMARRRGQPPHEELLPHWRTRSVEPVLDEMALLRERYGKRCIVFVDDVWNADAAWSARFADELPRRRLDLNWFAFMRADHLERDLDSGLFAQLVAGGLRHICVGLERAATDELASLHKRGVDADRAGRMVRRLRRDFPAVFLQTTFIVGLRDDTPADLDRVAEYAAQLDPDYPAFHPLTPVPGTAMWHEANERGWLEIKNFARYDWMTPVMSTATMTRDELEQKIWEMNRRWMSVWRVLRGLFTRHAYRRRMYLWWLLVSARAGADFALDRVLPSRATRRKASLADYVGLIKPAWYDD